MQARARRSSRRFRGMALAGLVDEGAVTFWPQRNLWAQYWPRKPCERVSGAESVAQKRDFPAAGSAAPGGNVFCHARACSLRRATTPACWTARLFCSAAPATVAVRPPQLSAPQFYKSDV
jgi:hypothetical protein